MIIIIEPITLVVDASGLTISKKGDYIEEKWIRKKKEFIKLHISADAESKKVVSFRITRGNVHDAKTFCPLVRESFKKYNIDKVCADKAQDNRRNFNLLERLDVEPVIAIRNNASIYKKKKMSVKKRRNTINQETWISEVETDERHR